MRPHPTLTVLRFAGLTVGFIMFVFMAYRASQTADSKIAVQGKPHLATAAVAPDSSFLAASTQPGAYSTVSVVAGAAVSQPAPAVAASTASAPDPAPSNDNVNAVNANGNANGHAEKTPPGQANKQPAPAAPTDKKSVKEN